MIENFRSELVWKTMRKNPYVVAGLRRAGFTGGWLEASEAAPRVPVRRERQPREVPPRGNAPAVTPASFSP
jgi:hypothetical protein